jgi:hypothetical protein
MKFARLAIYLAMVLLFGGLGCWIALGQHLWDPVKYDYRNFIANIGTFAISLVILGYADKILSKKETAPTTDLFIFFIMVISVTLSVVGIIFYFKYANHVVLAGLIIGFICWMMIV